MIDIDEVARIFSEPTNDIGPRSFWTCAAHGFHAAMRALPQERLASFRGDPAFLLDEHLSEILSRSPGDVEALWGVIGSDVRHNRNTLTESAWTSLLTIGSFEPRWLLEHAEFVEKYSGVSTAPALATLLKKHSLVKTIKPDLDALSQSSDISDRDWSARLVSALTNEANRP
jgi:hypothetical protein